MIQWLRLNISTLGSAGSTPGQELRSHMLSGKFFFFLINKTIKGSKCQIFAESIKLQIKKALGKDKAVVTSITEKLANS